MGKSPHPGEDGSSDNQELLKEQIPLIQLPHEAGTLRIIAGEAFGEKDPAHTVTPINLWDLSMAEGGSVEFDLPENTNTLILGLAGQLRVDDQENLAKGELARFAQEGNTISIAADEASRALILNGTPIEEPVAAHGPFVMNTRDEISEAIQDFQAGKMGHLG